MELTTEQIKQIQQVRVWAMDAAIAETNALQNLVEARTPERLAALIDESKLRSEQANAAWNKYVATVRDVTGFDYVDEVLQLDDRNRELDEIRKGEGGR